MSQMSQMYRIKFNPDKFKQKKQDIYNYNTLKIVQKVMGLKPRERTNLFVQNFTGYIKRKNINVESILDSEEKFRLFISELIFNFLEYCIDATIKNEEECQDIQYFRKIYYSFDDLISKKKAFRNYISLRFIKRFYIEYTKPKTLENLMLLEICEFFHHSNKLDENIIGNALDLIVDVVPGDLTKINLADYEKYKESQNETFKNLMGLFAEAINPEIETLFINYFTNGCSNLSMFFICENFIKYFGCNDEILSRILMHIFQFICNSERSEQAWIWKKLDFFFENINFDLPKVKLMTIEIINFNNKFNEVYLFYSMIYKHYNNKRELEEAMGSKLYAKNFCSIDLDYVY